MTSSSDTSNTLLVIDGHSMAFRAFYALPAENFATSTGQHTNAVYGFVTMMLSMIRDHRPTHLAVAFDLSGPTFRSEQYEEYKAGRAETPQEFAGQIELIGQVLEALNIPAVTVESYEADDIVATFAHQAADAGWKAIVVSGDRDTFQLIDDNISVLYPTKGVSEIPPMTSQTVQDKYGVTPQQYPELAALVGESADNLPGVPGVGPGFASKWLKQYGSLEAIIEHADEIGGKKGQALREHLDDVKRNRRLNGLVTDLELPVTLEDTELTSPDREDIGQLFDTLEFNRVRERLFTTFDTVLGTSSAPEDTHPEIQSELLTTADQLTEFLTSNAPEEGSFGVYFGLSAPEVITRRKIPAPGDYGLVTTVALAGDEKAAVIDLATASVNDTEDANVALIKALQEFLQEEGQPKTVYDLKSTLKAFTQTPLPYEGSIDDIAGVTDDVLLSAYVLQPDRRSYELDALVQTYLNATLSADPADAKGKNTQGAFDFGEATELSEDQVRYAGQAASMIRRICAATTPELVERNAQDLVTDLEIPLSRVLARMEETGITVDRDRLDELHEEFAGRARQAQEKAWESIGGEQVNLGSPKQLQVVLFETLGLPKTRKTKTGYSTDADSLTDLLEKTDHEFLHSLMAYRDATKLDQTVMGLLDTIASDDRVHTTYSQTAAATGRLSSLNPNLQNIPVRTESGRRIRDIFIAGTIPSVPDDEPTILLTADYSQIEMRIMAHLSEDDGLIQAYQDGEDLHRFVGSKVFEVAPEEVTSSMRDKVKAMSYGLAYGLSSYGLSKQLRIPVDEARELMSSYFDRFGAVQAYLRDVVKQARKDGYTSTMFGRRRYLPDLQSTNRQLRDMAERAALNAPIQGSAADLIKRAMLGVQRRLDEEQLHSRMLLQVHDELILEVPASEEEVAERILVEEMSSADTLRVPLEVQVGKGRSWHDAAH